MIWAVQLLLCVLLIGLSSFFSGSETGVYRLSRFRLRVGLQQGRSGVRWLARALRDGHGLMLSLLTGNNLVNYLLTSLVTMMLLSRARDPHAAELTATLIITPTLFVFGEILPKTLYYHRADVLLPRFGPVLWFFHALFTYTGIVPVLKGATVWLNRLVGVRTDTSTALAASARHQVHQLIQETREEGLLSPLQRQILQQLIAAPNIQVRQVMVPLRQVEGVDVRTDRAGLRDALAGARHDRLCVYDERPDRIIGLVNAPALLAGGEAFADLRRFVQPLRSVCTTCSVLDALVQMRTRGERTLIVTAAPRTAKDAAAPPPAVGILTLQDLLEELTGQIRPA